MRKASLLELCHDEKKYETFSISENNESLLSNCLAKKKYEIVNIQVKYKTSNYEYRFDNTMCTMVDDEFGIKPIDS